MGLGISTLDQKLLKISIEINMVLGRHADEQRLVHLYHYLCACLAMQQKAGGEANASAIAERLGSKDLRRIIGQLLEEEKTWEQKQVHLGKLGKSTTGSVVEILDALNRSLQDDYQHHQEPYTRVLSPDDILTVLYKLIDLTPDERKALGLPSTDGLTLLKRALLILQTTGDLENHEMLFQVYKAAVGLSFGDNNTPLDTLKEVDKLVSEVVIQALEYLPQRSDSPSKRVNAMPLPSKENTVLTLTKKAQREVRRLLTRSGSQISPITNNDTVLNSYIRKYLLPTFVTKLSQTVVANERLTDQFPVYLKRVSINPCGPLPFADQELDGIQQVDGPYPPLLHPALRRLDQASVRQLSSELAGPGDYELAAQEAIEIVAEFYVKVPEDYSPAVEASFHRLASQNRRRIDFSLRSIGVGGTLSHVIKVINSALLWDIPCLQEYFPIGHDITSTQKIIQDDVASPVWAHSLVKLCLKETVARTLQAPTSTRLGAYEEFSFAEPIGHGDYCGFDFVISQGQSALHARLQAIRDSGVSPSTYIQHLCHRTERFSALEDAQNRRTGYPFSTLAMISLIEENIMATGVNSTRLEKKDSYIYFDACLSIIEALLEEGFYRPAFRYLERLEVLDEFVDQGLSVNQSETEDFEIFSGALIIRYLLCLANYYYLYDTEENSIEYLPPGCPENVNREGLIQRAWNTLNRAQTHVRIRMQKYVAINEVSQSIFSPHYLLLSKIVFLKAKLMLFFPQIVPLDNSQLPTDNKFGRDRVDASIHWGRLYLTEKARLYAAADGEGELYSCYAAIQCWMYLIAAYTEPESLNLRPHLDSDISITQLSNSDCIRWGKKLRNHALISYAKSGRKYYYQIKEKSGLPKINIGQFGSYFIQGIPAIFEFRGESKNSESRNFKDLLSLDMSLLAINPKELPKLSPNHPEETIYLFGSSACYLFFARGLYMLCGNESEEFSTEDSSLENINWQSKLLHTVRLFNMAWGIAEEGCSLSSEKRSGERHFIINRAINNEDEIYSANIPPEVRSIRDLYPRRISELADLGKVFAAASMVLCASTTRPESRESFYGDAEALLSQLHSTDLLDKSRTLNALTKRQKRYNGHLSNYFRLASELIRSYRDTENRNDSDTQTSMYDKRNSLVKGLFSLLENAI